jgi:histidinol-phosphatase (PHP family)
MQRILYDTHMHTPLCKHAEGEPEEYAEAAERRGLKGIIVTCHNPVPGGWSATVRMGEDEFDAYVGMVDRARRAFAGRVDVRLGIESDYVPGFEPYLARFHERAPFHYVLGSVHPQIKEYKEAYLRPDAEPQEYHRTYFQHLAMAAESGLFDALSHPDLVKNIFPSRWDPNLILDDIRRSLDRIAKTGVAMELNTSGLNKAYGEMNPGRAILAEMSARRIPVVVGSDSHVPARVGDKFEEAFDILRDVGYSEVCFYLDRKPTSIIIADARASLRPPPALLG